MSKKEKRLMKRQVVISVDKPLTDKERKLCINVKRERHLCYLSGKGTGWKEVFK